MIVGAAAPMMTFCVFDPAMKFVVAAVLAFTTQVPAPLELNVAAVAVALTKAHGPPVVVNVSAPSELFAVRVTTKLPPK